MYCPNCGQSNEIGQRFCRKCGLNLEAIGESILSQLNAGQVEPVDRRLEMFGNIVFGGLGVVGLAAVSGLIYAVVTGFILSGKGVVFGIIVSALIVFLVLALVYVILNEVKKDKKTKRPVPAGKPELEKAETARLLDTGRFEPVPSVVEDTTELLKVEVPGRRS